MTDGSYSKIHIIKEFDIMKINSVALIFFSPTGTTKKILTSISKGMGIKKTKVIDLTFMKYRQSRVPVIEEDIVIIGVPVYEEKIPQVVRLTIEEIKGKGQPIVLVAVYGNIGYGIVLKELNSIIKKEEFVVVGGATFIGEHSFSKNEVAIGKGRPDTTDVEKAKKFGVRIIKKLEEISNLNEINEMKFPGILPLMAKLLPKNSARFLTKDPNPDDLLCNKCGVCVKICPVQAISSENFKVKKEKCLRCFACVRRCKLKAREIEYKSNFLVARFLNSKGSKRKEPEMFL